MNLQFTGDVSYKWKTGRNGKDLNERLYFHKDRDLRLYEFSLNGRALGKCETMGLWQQKYKCPVFN